MEGTLKIVTLLIFTSKLFSLFFTVYCDNSDERFVALDGILVSKTELTKAESERKKVEEAIKLEAKFDQEEALLYNESRKWTENLPNKCQG